MSETPNDIPLTVVLVHGAFAADVILTAAAAVDRPAAALRA
jgi:hypothetical protein